MTKKVTKNIIQQENILNCFQACNNFKLSGRSRRVMLRKYDDNEMSEENWKIIFQREGMLKV